MQKMISIIGIIFVAIGTILSLWSVLSTNTKHVGTAGWYDNSSSNFRKEKRNVIIGVILIIVGSFMQIVGIFM